MKYQVHQEGKFQFIDEGKGETLLLLHDLFGALSNWDGIIHYFSSSYRVIIPLLPIFQLSPKEAGLEALLVSLEDFVAFKNLTNITVIGNSLGGHIGLLYTLKHQDNVRRLVLTASSGLFEDSMKGSFPKRGSYDYIKERVAYTFYDPDIATKDLVDEVFETTSSIQKCINIIGIAKSAQRHNMAKDLYQIKVPTLLIWGLNDTITPAHVAYDFNRLIAGSELHFLDKCCHAPMMERPAEFNTILERFLKK